MKGLDQRTFAPHKDEGRPEVTSQEESSPEANNPNIEDIKDWEEIDGKVCLKRIDVVSTPLWHAGWYKNPTSGRSNNYGVNTENPQEHATVVVKGGCFFVDEKTKEFFGKNSVSLNELYGGISFDAAKKEYDIAALIQENFRSLLHKKANCPEPVDVKVVTSVLTENGEIVELTDFFRDESRKEEGKAKFTSSNFVHTAVKLGIDPFYPMSGEADKSVKDDAFGWLFGQCLEKSKQSVYRYKIDGPNTRLLDLMTLPLADRQKYFIEANNATDIHDAVEKFASKLGEFYGVLHKSNIGYHSGSSEHCTLVDITISGVIMDIGGLTQNASVSKQSESYLAQIIKTTNLISYVCENILKLDKTVSERALSVFREKYKNLCTDETAEYFLKTRNNDNPEKIRTQYYSALAGDWIILAPDLKELSSSE